MSALNQPFGASAWAGSPNGLHQLCHWGLCARRHGLPPPAGDASPPARATTRRVVDRVAQLAWRVILKINDWDYWPGRSGVFPASPAVWHKRGSRRRRQWNGACLACWSGMRSAVRRAAPRPELDPARPDPRRGAGVRLFLRRGQRTAREITPAQDDPDGPHSGCMHRYSLPRVGLLLSGDFASGLAAMKRAARSGRPPGKPRVSRYMVRPGMGAGHGEGFVCPFRRLPPSPRTATLGAVSTSACLYTGLVGACYRAFGWLAKACGGSRAKWLSENPGYPAFDPLLPDPPPHALTLLMPSRGTRGRPAAGRTP